MDWLSKESKSIDPKPNGYLILVDKPLEWTSFGVVKKIKNTLRKALDVRKLKIGHGGTLDPLATGLLILGVGRGTKRLQEIQGLEKSYTGTLFLGASTPSYDLETTPTEAVPIDDITLADIKEAARALTGNIMQRPPDFSALKKGGKPAYLKARAGHTDLHAPRPVTVQQFAIDSFTGREVTFRVVCSKGTYIRSLAHDLGQILGCGAYLTDLRRTSTGPYGIEEAWSIDELVSFLSTFEA